MKTNIIHNIFAIIKFPLHSTSTMFFYDSIVDTASMKDHIDILKFFFSSFKKKLIVDLRVLSTVVKKKIKLDYLVCF